jgi:hypothetical protein
LVRADEPYELKGDIRVGRSQAVRIDRRTPIRTIQEFRKQGDQLFFAL